MYKKIDMTNDPYKIVKLSSLLKNIRIFSWTLSELYKVYKVEVHKK